MKKKPDLLIIGILAVASFIIGGWAASHLTKNIPGKLVATNSSFGWSIDHYARIGTGLQRADDIAFYSNGSRLAMTCPRYTRLTLWQTRPDLAPLPLKTIELEGRPQRLVSFGDKVIVVERPPGDDRHIKPGFMEVFDAEGRRIGEPVELGWEPDDLVLAERDGRLYGLILLSGNAEGEDNRPNGSVRVVEIDPNSFQIKEINSAEIPEVKKLNQDPLRIASASIKSENHAEKHVAMITLGRSGAVRRLDWTNPASPVWGEELKLPDEAEPVGAAIDATGHHLVTASSKTGQALAIPLNPAEELKSLPKVPESIAITAIGGLSKPFFDMRSVVVSEDASKVGFLGEDYFVFKRLRGPYGFGSVRLMDVAAWENDSSTMQLAICDRSGGLHWVVVRRQSAAD